MLNIETKIEIIEKFKKGECGSSLTQFYNVGKFTIIIGDIKCKKENILSYVSKMNLTNSKKTIKVMKSATNVKLDEILFMWFVQKRNFSDPVSRPV